jgi:HD-GYP domain-containing protein (c-di-GMP phosphodiesterase class II)
LLKEIHIMAISARQVIVELSSAERALLQVALLVENRDLNCSGHPERLAQFSSIMGCDLGLPRRNVVTLIKAAFFHDIGMIVVPEALIGKPEPLTPEERERVNKHPLVGARILSPVSNLKDVIPIVQSHHERSNGQGYPQQLPHGAIPDLALIFSVLDVYDALTSPRAHRPAYSVVEALKILEEEAEWGNHDKDIVTCLGDLVEKNRFEGIDLSWRACEII